jgi:hypothetical protein
MYRSVDIESREVFQVGLFEKKYKKKAIQNAWMAL